MSSKKIYAAGENEIISNFRKAITYARFAFQPRKLTFQVQFYTSHSKVEYIISLHDILKTQNSYSKRLF